MVGAFIRLILPMRSTDKHWESQLTELVGSTRLLPVSLMPP